MYDAYSQKAKESIQNCLKHVRPKMKVDVFVQDTARMPDRQTVSQVQNCSFKLKKRNLCIWGIYLICLVNLIISDKLRLPARRLGQAAMERGPGGEDEECLGIQYIFIEKMHKLDFTCMFNCFPRFPVAPPWCPRRIPLSPPPQPPFPGRGPSCQTRRE